MNLSIRRICPGAFSLLVSLAACAADVPVSENHPLDGSRFQGQTGEQGKGNHHEDTITFEDGRFRSLDCENWGFGPAPYSAWTEGDAYRFAATLHSDDRGTLDWTGTIRDDTAEATFRWIHERWYWSIDRSYWFKGKRQ